MRQTLRGDLPMGRGIVTGAGAWITGILVTNLLLSVGTWGEILARAASQAPVTISLAVYLDVHSWAVGTQFTADYLPYTAIPVGLLLGAGFLTATAGDRLTPQAGLARGVTVALGYVLVALLTIAVMVVLEGSPDSSGGGTILRVVVAAVVCPVVFAGIGGVVAGVRPVGSVW